MKNLKWTKIKVLFYDKLLRKLLGEKSVQFSKHNKHNLVQLHTKSFDRVCLKKTIFAIGLKFHLITLAVKSGSGHSPHFSQ